MIMKSSIEALLKQGSLELQNVAEELNLKPHFESEILLAFTLKKPRVYLHTHTKDSVESPLAEHYLSLIKMRKNGMPIEYITQSASFYGYEFFVNPDVLIPRPETELLIEEARAIIEAHNIRSIAEIGIGSGVITTTLARLMPQCHFFATDISLEALNVAKQNIATHAKEANITLRHCAYLPNDMPNFELLVSNPPYIEEGYPISKPLTFEPKVALFGGKDGLDVYREIIKLVSNYSNVWLVCEIGYNQKAALEALLKGAKHIHFFKDLSGLDRGFSAYFP